MNWRPAGGDGAAWQIHIFFYEGVMQVKVVNPRLAAQADIQLEGGVQVTVSFERDDNELIVIERIKQRVADLSAVSVANGGAAVPMPSDEALAPVLAVLRRMQDQVKDLG